MPGDEASLMVSECVSVVKRRRRARMTVYRLVGEVMVTFRLIEYIKEGTISGSFENKTNNSIGIFYWKKGANQALQ